MNPETLSPYFNNISSSNGDNLPYMNIELLRLFSFSKYNGIFPVCTIQLSAAGLYYVGVGEKVKCYKCDFTKERWQASDNALKEHRDQNPHCPVVSGQEISDNVPVAPVENFRECFNSLPIPDDSGDHYLSIESEISLEERYVSGDANLSNRSSGNPVLMGSQPSPSGTDRRESLGSGQARSRSSSNPNSLPEGDHHRSQIDEDRNQDPQVGSGAPGTSTSSLPNYPRSREAVRKVINSQQQNLQGGSSSSSSVVSASQFFAQGNQAILRFEKNRLESFKKWPSQHPIMPKQLAEAGFFYTGYEDRVQCFSCNLILKAWERGDNPKTAHKERKPMCRFILGMEDNVPVADRHPQGGHKTLASVNQGQGHAAVGSSVNELEAIGISSQRPKYPHFAVEGKRIESYANKWPRNKDQTPEQLSAAGFFYAGFNDNVKCFFCDGGLKNWETGDDPWEEHARWFPKCTYLNNMKGAQYIDAVQTRHFANASTSHQALVRGRSASGVYHVEERELTARLDTSLVVTVLKTGVSKDVVKEVIRRRLLEKGEDFRSSEDLMNAVMDSIEKSQAAQRVRRSSSTTPRTNLPLDRGSDATGGRSNSVPILEDASPTRAATENDEIRSDSGATSIKGSPAELSEEIRQLREQKLCKICLDEEVGIVFVPCGHLCCCVKCGPAVNQCPICRANIKGSVRTFIS